MRLFTVGHSTRAAGRLIALLAGAGVALVADVRSVPRSRANPQFNAGALAAALDEAGIGYRHLEALGGLRGRQRLGRPSPNTLWTEAGFRNYADYALTPPFRAGLDELLALAAGRSCAVMCAEAVPWRCHRRIIADHLLARGVEVVHILGPGRLAPATLTPGAEVRPDGAVHYPPAEPPLL